MHRISWTPLKLFANLFTPPPGIPDISSGTTSFTPEDQCPYFLSPSFNGRKAAHFDHFDAAIAMCA